MKTKRQNGVSLWDIKPDLGIICNLLWVYYTLLIYIYIYENYAKHTKQVVLGCASRAQTDLAVTHATLTQLTVQHLQTKVEQNFATWILKKKT